MELKDWLIEIGTNLFDATIFVGFVFFMLEPKYTKVKNIAFGLVAVAVMFTALNWFLFNGIPFNYIDSFTYIVIMCVYSFIALKGNPLLKTAVCVFGFLINTVLSYLFGFLVSALTGVSFLDLATKPVIGRYVCIVVIIITNLLAYIVIIKLKKSLMVIRKTDLAAFVVVPLLALVIIYSSVLLLFASDFMSSLLPYLLAIDISMIAVTVIIWLMMSRISKDNEIKTELLLTQQREALYKDNALQTNLQIEKISRIKHDMINDVRCINNLIIGKNYEEAEKYCNTVANELNAAYTPIATSNILLNAVLNVQLEKAAEAKVKLVTTVQDDIKQFNNFSDMNSIIGNLCDNAIEYVSNNDLDDRRIRFSISKDDGKYIISCTNAVKDSILKNNPELKTTKSDAGNHGYGISIIRETAQKYSGDLICDEQDGYITFSVVLKI
ncbi:MAG: GHKL domain-containing protein [Clostridiales bacterium]|nr:GHKL domain-containing protein [Clostridiales bacterium]